MQATKGARRVRAAEIGRGGAVARRRALAGLTRYRVTLTDGHERMALFVRAAGALDACEYALRVYPGANELRAEQVAL